MSVKNTMSANVNHPLYITGTITLTLAMIACGISFFGPYWLMNVTHPAFKYQSIESDLGYLSVSLPSAYIYRGLWAQCFDVCQWFWEDDYLLQKDKFTPLAWHLATQVLYFIGAFLVLFCEVFARVQICCRQRKAIYRSIGFILLSSFVLQAAAVAVFGGFASRDYGATANMQENTYLGWCFWMTIAGGGLTLISGILFLFMDCSDYDDYDM